MFVCICKTINEKHLEDALTFRPDIEAKELCDRLGIGKDCGECLMSSLELIRRKKEKTSPIEKIVVAGSAEF